MNQVHFSSVTSEWATPQAFFDVLDAEFGFTLDPCATSDNAKCPNYFTADDDGLSQPWSGVVFMNPPYGHGLGRWIRKAYRETQLGCVVVALIPARTDTSWWHECVMRAAEIRLVRGRIRFIGVTNVKDPRKGTNGSFPSAVVVFRPGIHTPRFVAVERDGRPSQPNPAQPGLMEVAA